MNREQWLTELAKMVEPLFKGFRLTEYKISCSWPTSRGLSVKRRVLGECHAGKHSKAGVHELFITPLLDDPIEVGGVVVHEMAHVGAGVEAQHGPKFVKVCRHVGLTKNKPTSAAPGEKLVEQLKKMAEKLGPYPHKALIHQLRPVKPKKDVTLRCGGCGCLVRISINWLDKAGPPTCACGENMSLKLVDEGDDDA